MKRFRVIKGGHGSQARKRERAIEALLTERTMADAARASGVSQPTLYRWLATEEFGEQYRAARRQVLESAMNSLRQSADTAALVLREVAEDSAAPAAARVGACRTILDSVLRIVETEDIAARLDRLERSYEPTHKAAG